MIKNSSLPGAPSASESRPSSADDNLREPENPTPTIGALLQSIKRSDNGMVCDSRGCRIPASTDSDVP